MSDTKTFFVVPGNLKVELGLDTSKYPDQGYFRMQLTRHGYEIFPVPEAFGTAFKEVSQEEFENWLTDIRTRALLQEQVKHSVDLKANSPEFPYKLEVPADAPQDLTQMKRLSISEFSEKCRLTRERLAATKDSIKLAGYNAKVVIANSVLQGTANPYQLKALEIEIGLRGLNETPKQLAEKIIKNSYELSVLICGMDGVESKVVRSIAAATTAAEIAQSVLEGTQLLESTANLMVNGEQKPQITQVEIAGMPVVSNLA